MHLILSWLLQALVKAILNLVVAKVVKQLLKLISNRDKSDDQQEGTK